MSNSMKIFKDIESNESEIAKLKEKIRKLEKENKLLKAQYKEQVNKETYTSNLESKFSTIKYISGYRSSSKTRNYKILVQDKRTKIRFFVNSGKLRNPNWSYDFKTMRKSTIYPEDLLLWYKATDRDNQGHKIKRTIKPVIFMQCKLCGRTFESKFGRQFCSLACKKKWNNRLREKRKSLRTKKAKENGKYDNTITLEKVFKRDKGICYICGKKLTLDTFYNNPLAPTIEHVIPIIKGGTHTWNNVKLACRRCNNLKGSKLGKELLK